MLKKTLQKKIVLQFDVQHFICKDLPFELISNYINRYSFFQIFSISPDFFIRIQVYLTKEYKESEDIIATLRFVNG